MEGTDVKRLALILAVQAEIEGMKIENLCRELAGHSPSYNESIFNIKAEELRELAYKHSDTL